MSTGSSGRSPAGGPQRPLQLSTALLSSSALGPSTLGASGSSIAASAVQGSSLSGGRSGLLQQYASAGIGANQPASGGQSSSVGGTRRPGGGGESAPVVLNAGQMGMSGSLTHARTLGPAKLKLDELFLYWASLPATSQQVDQFVSSALREAGVAPSRAPGQIVVGAATRSQAAEEAVVDSSDEEYEAPCEQMAAGTTTGTPLSPESMAAAPPVGTGTNNPRNTHHGSASNSPNVPDTRSKKPPGEMPAPLSGSTGGGSLADVVPNVAVSMEDLPTSDLGTFTLATSPRGGGTDSGLTTPSKQTLAAAKKANCEMMPSPRFGSSSGGLGHTPPTRTPRDKNYLSPAVVVDELEVGHRLGALSPRAVSPANLSLDVAPAKSPFDVGLRSPRAPPFGLEPGPPKSRSPSPQPGGRHHSSPPLVSNAPTDDSDKELTPRPSVGGRRRSVSSLGSSLNELPLQGVKLPVATLNDIPRFHYPRGRPTANGSCLAEELGGAKAAGGASSSGAVRAAATGGPLSIIPPSTTPATKARADEQKEIQQLEKIVGQVVATTAAAAASPATAAAPGGKRGSTASANSRAGKRPGTSGGGGGAPDTAAAVQAAVLKLTTEVFGLPGVLAPIIASRVVRQPGNHLTTTAVRSFYDSSIAKNSKERRIFEVLLGSNPQAPAIERGGQGQKRNYLVKEDFTLLLNTLVDQHPGLGFLKEAVDFQSKYVDTVIHRVFYECDPRDTGRVTWEAFARSSLPGAIEMLSKTDEINQVLAYFSYEHFYVLYCRFWELDSDKDLQINAADLERYFHEQTANDLVVKRIFAGAGRKLSCKAKDRMSYDDFIYFCMSEEDKTSPRALKYWFKILDTDGDGILSGYELSAFYEITKRRLEQLTGEAIAFPDVMCQIADMLVGPAHDGHSPPSPTAPSLPSVASAPHLNLNKPGSPRVGSGSAAVRPLTGMDMLTRLNTKRSASPAASVPSSPLGSSSAPTPARGTASKPPQGAAKSAVPRGASNDAPTSRTLFPAPSQPSSLPPGVDPMTVGFTLNDLLRRPIAAGVAITMITNVGKFLHYEQRDPFVIQHELSQAPERNDWDRFCRAEYDRMSMAEDEG
jgi:Ca2+-binding EF-hand superfamily protein